MATTIGKGYRASSRHHSIDRHIPYKELLLHNNRCKVLPTTVLVARESCGRRDMGYPFPSLDPIPSHLPIQTSLFLSFHHLLCLNCYVLTNAISDHLATDVVDYRTVADYHGNQAAI